MDYQDIKRLLKCLFTEKICFILGAGVSIRLIPATAEFNRKISLKDEVWIYDVDPNTTYPIHKVFSSSNDKGYLSHITYPTLKIITLKNLIKYRQPHLIEAIPPEYAIFRKLPTSSNIIDFNLDGFSQRWCPQRCLCPHGLVQEYVQLCISDEERVNNFIEYFQDHQHEDTKIFPNHNLFEKEKNNGDFKHVYSFMENILLSSNAVILIGYSFALTNDGFNDICTLNLFSKIIKKRKIPVFVINPFSYSLSVTLKELCKSNDIFPYDLLWNRFAVALLNSLYRRKRCIKQISSREVMADYN